MHKDERWQEYTKNGLPIQNGGLPAGHGFNPTQSNLYAVSCIWLYRIKNNTPEILFQRRSQYVDRHAGEWDVSAGGHINYGEDMVTAAVRECTEEIGATINAKELNYLYTVNNGSRIAHVFVVDYTDKPNKIENFKFDDHEVSEVAWVPLNAFKKFAKECCKKPLATDGFQIKTIYNTILARTNNSNGNINQ